MLINNVLVTMANLSLSGVVSLAPRRREGETFAGEVKKTEEEEGDGEKKKEEQQRRREERKRKCGKL